MPIKDFYNSLHSDMKSILEKALQEDNLNDVAIAHSFMTDFGVSIFMVAAEECGFSCPIIIGL